MVNRFQRAGLQFWFLLPVILAILASIVFWIIVVARIQYPFELEWIEGAYLDQARWIAAGNPLYTAPVIEFIPTNKTPVFFLISALFIRFFGEGFFAVRLLSLLSVVGTILLLGLLVYKSSTRFSAAIVGMGLYLASYRFTGSWMDLGKTDSLFLFWILFGFYWCSVKSNKFHSVLMALALVLAYYTKQMALPILVVMAVISLTITRFSWWKAWLLVVVLGVGVFLTLDYTTDGWFSFYTLDTTIRHNLNEGMIWLFWRKVLPFWWPSILVLGMYSAAMAWKIRQKETPFQPFALVVGFWLGLLAASWSVFFKVWTYDNDLMPIALGSALIGGMAYGEFANTVQQTQSRKQILYGSVMVFLLMAQFFLWRYHPIQQLPTRQDYLLGQQFTAHLASLEGDVWVYNHGFYGALAEKRTFLHSSPFGDIAGVASPGELPEDIARRRNLSFQLVKDAIEGQRFSWIYVDNSPERWLPYYLPVEQFFAGKDGLLPLTGVPTRPEHGLFRNPVIYGGTYPLDSPYLDIFYTEGWMQGADGRELQRTQGAISVALLAGREYTLDVSIVPRCVGEHPVVESLALYWNEYLFHEESVTECGEITIKSISLPTDGISGALDAFRINLQLANGIREGNWHVVVRELTFHMLDNSLDP